MLANVIRKELEQIFCQFDSKLEAADEVSNSSFPSAEVPLSQFNSLNRLQNKCFIVCTQLKKKDLLFVLRPHLSNFTSKMTVIYFGFEVMVQNTGMTFQHLQIRL